MSFALLHAVLPASTTGLVPPGSHGLRDSLAGSKKRAAGQKSFTRGLPFVCRAASTDAKNEHAYDVVVIGAGISGATFAKHLAPEGLSVLLVDAGAQNAGKPGWHMKNSYKFQKDIDSFASHIRSALHTLSVPTDWRVVDNLDPLGYNPFPGSNGFVRMNQNPYQMPQDNLPAAAATYAVGGMATHWTASCPRPHPELEANELFPHATSYDKAEALLKVNQKTFMPFSIRDQVLNEVLKEAYEGRVGSPIPDKPLPGSKYKVGPQPLPLAAARNPKNKELVTWTGADTVLGPELINMHSSGGREKPSGYGNFRIMDNTVCKCLKLSSSGDEVTEAVVFDTMNGEEVRLKAKTFVVAAGTVLTPQIVWASLEDNEPDSAQSRLPALGHYLTEQPMAFCQVVWREDIIKKYFIPRLPHPEPPSRDPVPLPPNDPEPNQWIPVSTGRPWHAQIHRDAFAYGDAAPNVDNRMIVDLRFFGIVEQQRQNHVEFRTCGKEVKDIMGLPQPTFHFKFSDEEKLTMHDMMEDMVYYATKIGGFMPGSEPQFMKPGLSLHIHGTNRVGLDARDSVVDRGCKVHGISNLYLGGNGLIPRAIACNPTVTNVAYAIEASQAILKKHRSKKSS